MIPEVSSPQIIALVLLATILGLTANFALATARRKRLLAQYKAAFERGDVDALARARRLLRAGLPDSAVTTHSELVGDGELLILRERWAEARDVLAKIDRAVLPEVSRPGVLNNLAYATALAGEPVRGAELARQAIDEAKAQGASYPREKHPFLRGTLGVALSLAGEHEEAIALLEPLLGEGPKRAIAARAFHLGGSLRALGRFEEAERAFGRGAAQDGPFAQRCRDALGAMTPHRG